MLRITKKITLVTATIFCTSALAQEIESSTTTAATTVREIAATGVSLDDVIAKSLKQVIEKTSQTKGRVAIMDFPSLETGGITSLSTYVSNKAGNQMINAGRQVVDRAALERIISEQKLQQNALMDAATAAKVGRLAGAGVFVIGNYSVLSKKFVFTVRALSVETGQFIAASEETVPMNEELRAEINELHGKKGVEKVAADLSGGNTETITEDEYQKQLAAAEVKFDIELCKKIRPGLDITDIYGLAAKHGIMEVPKEFINGVNCKDSLGEDGDGPCYNVSSWTFTGSRWGIDSSDIAKAYKGKTPGIVNNLQSWSYTGPANLPGLETCAPNGSEWNDKRMSNKPSKR